MKKHRLAVIAAAAMLLSAGTVYFPGFAEAVTVNAEASGKLAPPDSFRASSAGERITLRWDKVSGADAYRVFIYDTGTHSYKSYKTLKKNSLTITGLSAGTYRFRVAALIKNGAKYSVQRRSAAVKVKINGKEENMTDRITVNTQSSIRIDCGDKIIRIDPFRIPDEPHDADIVFITHEHYDHFSPEDLDKVCKPGTVIAAPASMKNTLKKAGITDPVLLAPDEKTEIDGIAVETVRAYNLKKSYHPRSSNWLGYIITVMGNRIYAAGDTDAVPEIGNVVCDIALVPIGGTFTMNAKEAAELINAIKPGSVIPIHYGSIVGDASDGKKFAGLVDKSIKVVLK